MAAAPGFQREKDFEILVRGLGTFFFLDWIKRKKVEEKMVDLGIKVVVIIIQKGG